MSVRREHGLLIIGSGQVPAIALWSAGTLLCDATIDQLRANGV